MNIIEQVEMNLSRIVSGWVVPSGKFYHSVWGHHTEKGYEIAQEYNWYEEYLRNHAQRLDIRDFLVIKKNCILLDNPTFNEQNQIIQYNKFKRQTKRQIGKLLKLFEYSEEATAYILQIIKESEE